MNLAKPDFGSSIAMMGALSLGILLLAAGPGGARADSLARASNTSLGGSLQIVEGSLTALGGSAQIAGASVVLVVDSVQVVGESVIVVLEGTAEASRVILQGTFDVVHLSTMAVGETITALLTTVGYVLFKGGRPIAFVPDENGRHLAHSSVFGRQ